MESINVYDLEAKITLDDEGYRRGLGEAGEETSKFGEKLKNGLATAAKITGTALGTAATGIAALAKQSIEGYAEYEQLVGGVETLFGAKGAESVQQYAEMVGKTVQEVSGEFDALILAQDTVIKNAQNAYSTAGLSANEYMNTVTSVSAALINSLGGDTVAAAAVADSAITDMADNANKMGTSMDSIIATYQSLSRGNFVMLDNLKLGYGATKEELERLLEDAEAFKASMGEIVDYDSSNFADIVEAIGTIQDKMGITGATAAEASTTIQGSVSAMKAAWENFLTGMADPTQDFGALVGSLVDSVVTVGENLIPRVVELAPRLTEGLEALVNAALPQIPVLLETLLPTLISSAGSLLASFTSLLPSILTTALSVLPQLTQAAETIAKNLLTALIESAPVLLDAGLGLLSETTNGIISGLPDMVAQLPQIIDEFLMFINENLGPIFEEGVTLLGELAFGIISAIPDLVTQLPQIISSITAFLVENFPKIVAKGAELLGQLIAGILGAIGEIAVNLPEVLFAIGEALSGGFEMLKGIGSNMLEGLWAGIQSKVAWLKEKAMGVINTVKGWFTGAEGFDTHSPSKWSEKVFRYIMEGGGAGLENGLPGVMRHVNHVSSAIKDGLAASTALPGVSVADRQTQAISGLTGAVLAGGNSGGTYEIIVQVGESEMARVLFDPIRQVAAQRGESFA